MSQTDRYGLPLSTASEPAAAAYRDGVDLMLSAWPAAIPAFETAITADPDFALPYAACARAHATLAQMDAARAHIAAAQTRVSARGSEREINHVAIVALALAGQSAQALPRALAHLEAWPRDAVIMSMPLGAFGLLAFSGRADHNQARVDLCEHHAPHYGDDWWFLTYRGWAHTENGDTATGLAMTQRAFDQRRNNANAVHALSHALFEDGATAAAETLLTEWLPGYGRTGLLYGHLHWHQALLALEQDDPVRALSIFSQALHPSVTAAFPLNALTDCASLLWRLHIADQPVPAELWHATEAYGERYFSKAGGAFADVHMGLIAAARHDRMAGDRRLGELDQLQADHKLVAGAVVPAVCRAAQCFAEGDFAGCARVLEPMAGEVVRIGGSHAQRELVEDTLLVALMKSGESAKARALLDERLHRRPSLRDQRWRAAVAG